MKGALSVAASAYKALFVGPTCTEQVSAPWGSGKGVGTLSREGFILQLLLVLGLSC